jgi:hypothetical protein
VTTEVVLLLGLCVFLLLGAFLGDTGPRKIFGAHGPRLAARVEAQLATGNGFATDQRGVAAWNQAQKPQGGKLQ